LTESDSNSGDELWGDSVYHSEKVEKVLKLLKFNSQIHERSYRNKPLTEEQKENNKIK
jgi:hypothetical protein